MKVNDKQIQEALREGKVIYRKSKPNEFVFLAATKELRVNGFIVNDKHINKFLVKSDDRGYSALSYDDEDVFATDWQIGKPIQEYVKKED